MDKNKYIKLLKGGGQRYKQSKLFILPNTASTVEERASVKVCPPPKLNPNYAPDPKVRRVGTIQPRVQPVTQQKSSIHPDVLKLIHEER